MAQPLLAPKSPLNRLELDGEAAQPMQEDSLLPTGHRRVVGPGVGGGARRSPDQIVLDLDTTDLPLHGHQQGRFFCGYYDSYCHLRLYIFSGEHLLCARVRTADQEAAAGSQDEVERPVRQIRAVWPAVQLYQDLCCERGEMGNRIQERLSLFAG